MSSEPDPSLIASTNDLGLMRTVMAADRTLMAWVRTSLSLLSFGYTIYKVLQQVESSGKAGFRSNAPQHAGFLLAVAGTVALIMGIIENRTTLRTLLGPGRAAQARPSLIMALLMAAAGIFLTFGIALRLL